MYLKSVENVITLGKLIGLLFLFCLPHLSILFLKTKRNDLVLPVMGTIFLVGERSEPLSDKLGGEICIATRALVCIYIYICVRPDDRLRPDDCTVPTLYVACAARAK